MGIYDRDYYRKEGPSFLGSWAHSGTVCMWLVGVNCAFYLIQLLTIPVHGDSYGYFTDWLVMKPEKAFYGLQLWRFVTGAFLHSPSSPWHLILNMLILWFFGRDVEELYGHWEFLSFYLVAGVVGNLFWGLTTLWQPLPIDYETGRVFYPMALGASGAVMAVMVLCTMHFPFRTIYFMFFLPIPLWLFTLLYVAADFFVFLSDLRHPGMSAGVAVAAHLGGAGFGFLYYKLQWRLLDAWASFRSLMRRSTRPRLRIYHEEEPAVSVASAHHDAVDEQLEAKADAVLEKVSREGMASLTPEERSILQQASEKYKKRRT